MLNQDILKDLDSLQQESQNQQIIHQADEEQEYEPQLKSDLLQSAQFGSHMDNINQLIDTKLNEASLKCSQNQKKIIHKSNEYAQKIDRQIAMLFRFAKAIYNKRFPELQSIVTKPALYCKAVSSIQTHYDKMAKGEATTIDQLKLPFLTPHQTISLKIAISSLHQQLNESQKIQLLEAVHNAILLHEHHNTLMIYLESSMQTVAPNLCQLVGSSIASKLISAAGGVDKLAYMPACNIQVLGGQRAAQVGFALMQRNHTGIFNQMEVVKDAPKRFMMQLVRMLATNTAKCARSDFLGMKNNQGAKLKQQMYERFQKIQEEGGLMRVQQPLPVPDQQPKKKRGGKRFRKMKQLYEMSDLRKNQNRTKFGQQAEQQISEGVGLGMLKMGMGKLKVNIKKQNLKVSKKMNQRLQKKSGLESSLDFGSKSGIQLINPNAAKQRQSRSGTQSYFAKQSGFRTILNNKMNGKQ